MTIDVKPCVYDPNYVCHVGCETLQDKPGWCTHKLDLYKKALELEKEIKGEEQTIERVVNERDPFNSNFFQSQSNVLF